MPKIEIVKRLQAQLRCNKCGTVWTPLKPRPKSCPNVRCQARFEYPDDWEERLREAGFSFVIIAPTGDAASEGAREA